MEAERRPRAPERVWCPPSASEWMPRPRAAAYHRWSAWLPMPTLLTLPTLLLLLLTPKTTMLLLLPMLLLLLLLPRAATLACYSSTPLFRRWFQV